MGRRKKLVKRVERWWKQEQDERKKNSSSDVTRSGDEEPRRVKNETLSKLLDIKSRLELPLLKLEEKQMILSGDSDDDEETLEFDIRPRFVYSCSTCLVCTRTSDPGITCDKCKMVWYCGREHLKDNGTSHAPLCEAMRQEFGGIEGFRVLTKDAASPENYRCLRIKLIDGVERKMRRPLDLWEREIILYPRICRACRESSSELIRCCNDCSFDYYCADHANEHTKWCKDFQVYSRILHMQRAAAHGGYAAASLHFPDVLATKALFSSLESLESLNFDTLLLHMFDGNDVNYRSIDAYTYASMSLSATAPLTALFALVKTRSSCSSDDDWSSRESIKIDIVGAEFQFECSDLRLWEKLFIHFLPRLKKLELEFTGPELRLPGGVPIQLLGRVPLCRRCKKYGRRVVVRFNEGKLYHQLLSAPSTAVAAAAAASIASAASTADLICLFNPGLYRDTGYDGTDTWPQTIQRFCRAKVPVVITSYTEIEIPKDIRRIQSIAKVQVILEPQINPFASIKPDRNFVSDDSVPFMYKNYCLSIVKGL